MDKPVLLLPLFPPAADADTAAARAGRLAALAAPVEFCRPVVIDAPDLALDGCVAACRRAAGDGPWAVALCDTLELARALSELATIRAVWIPQAVPVASGPLGAAHIGWVSAWMRDRLRECCGAPCVPARNGYHADDPRFAPLRDSVKRAALTAAGVPLHKPLLVGIGAPSPEGGLDTVAAVGARLGSAMRTVLLVDEVQQPDAETVDRLRAHNPACLVAAARDATLQAALCQWPNTRLVAVLPRAPVPFGFWLGAVRLHARGGGPLVLAANHGGLAEQVEHDVDGLLAAPDDVERIAAVVKAFMAWPEARQRTARQAAFARVCQRQRWTDSLRETLEAMAPQEGP